MSTQIEIPVWEDAIVRFLHANGDLKATGDRGSVYNLWRALVDLKEENYPLIYGSTQLTQMDLRFAAYALLQTGEYHEEVLAQLGSNGFKQLLEGFETSVQDDLIEIF